VLGERVADWLAAWNEPDATRRAGLLGRCLADGGRFRDPTAAVDGARPLADHIGTVQRLAGGRGWWAGARPSSATASSASGGRPSARARSSWPPGGTNVAEADLDGRFRWVTGFWDPPPDRPGP
jgi:hypothetical protein